MFCDNCGNKLRDGAKFCPKCGSKAISSIEEIRERQRLTPDFSGIDDSKPIYERIKDIDKPVFENSDDTKTETPKKNKKKLIVIVSAILICALIVGAFVFFATRPITVEKAYDHYIKELKYEKDEAEKEIDNIVLYDVNNSGIPDLIFSNDHSFKLFYDGDIVMGEITGYVWFDSLNTVFLADKIVYRMVQSTKDDEIEYEFFRINEEENHVLKYEPVFSVTYEKDTNEYSYYVDEQYSEKGKDDDTLGKELLRKIKNSKITIVYTDNSKETNELFLGDVDKTLSSMNYEQAIYVLEKRKIPK